MRVHEAKFAVDEEIGNDHALTSIETPLKEDAFHLNDESKINRIVDYFAKRPQVQERMTVQILDELKNVLDTEDVAVVIEGKHLCVAARGINDTNSTTVTSEYSGKFKEEKVKREFLQYIGSKLAIF